MKPGKRHFARGFTLVELLVVISLIGFLAGALGWALREATPTNALQSAQNVLAGLLSSARARATLNHGRVTLVVDADATSDGFLRRIHLAAETSPSSEQWQGVEEGVLLPLGVYVVPNGGLNAVSYSSERGAWPLSCRSTIELSPPGCCTVSPANGSGIYLRLSVPLGTAGGPDLGGGNRFVLAPGRKTPGGVEFSNPAAVRGVVLSAYGVALLINEARGFDF